MELVFRKLVSRGGFTLCGAGHELFRVTLRPETVCFSTAELRSLAGKLYEQEYGEPLFQAENEGVYYKAE